MNAVTLHGVPWPAPLPAGREPYEARFTIARRSPPEPAYVAAEWFEPARRRGDPARRYGAECPLVEQDPRVAAFLRSDQTQADVDALGLALLGDTIAARCCGAGVDPAG